ncbi:MAG: DAK2 domain-containing protein [Gaiella sp.]
MNGHDRIREITRHALAQLEANRARIDDLNVYPVPDGDTGSNLTLSVRAIAEAVETSTTESTATFAKEISRAALMGARGNSGVILSQIVRGFCEALGDHATVGRAEGAMAFAAARDAAYRAVRKPVEGTMLTVIREMAEEAEGAAEGAGDLVDLLQRVLARGEDALTRTPSMLPVLAEAGVVDAGGAGVVELVRGVLGGLTGQPLAIAADVPSGDAIHAIHNEPSLYRYCTVFVVEGAGLDAAALERELDAIGDSLLVVGDPSALKVHVHTDDPGRALSLGVAQGTIEGVEIANMHEQTIARDERLRTAGAALTVVAGAGEGIGIVAVAPGGGNRQLFERFGATVIEGGQTMNPSTADIVAAIEACPAEEVIVLPNNGNVVLTAEQAAGLTDKRVRVVPSTSVPAGLAAVVRFLPTASGDENDEAMRAALEEVATGEITTASRTVEIDGVAVREGCWLGLADGTAVACDEDFDTVALAVSGALLDGGRSMLTLLTGDSEPELGAILSALEARHPSLEIEVHEGGQPHYPLLLSAE